MNDPRQILRAHLRQADRRREAVRRRARALGVMRWALSAVLLACLVELARPDWHVTPIVAGAGLLAWLVLLLRRGTPTAEIRLARRAEVRHRLRDNPLINGIDVRDEEREGGVTEPLARRAAMRAVAVLREVSPREKIDRRLIRREAVLLVPVALAWTVAMASFPSLRPPLPSFSRDELHPEVAGSAEAGHLSPNESPDTRASSGPSAAGGGPGFVEAAELHRLAAAAGALAHDAAGGVEDPAGTEALEQRAADLAARGAAALDAAGEGAAAERLELSRLAPEGPSADEAARLGAIARAAVHDAQLFAEAAGSGAGGGTLGQLAEGPEASDGSSAPLSPHGRIDRRAAGEERRGGAALDERVPPRYRELVRHYFDRLAAEEHDR